MNDSLVEFGCIYDYDVQVYDIPQYLLSNISGVDKSTVYYSVGKTGLETNIGYI